MIQHFRIFIPVFLLMIISAISCQKNCIPRDFYYKVSGKTKSRLPYTGLDTLTFVRTTHGDTHTFIGQGIRYRNEIRTDAVECSPTYYHEVQSISYVSKTFKAPIVVIYNTEELSKGEQLIYFQNSEFSGSISFTDYANLDSINILGKNYYNVHAIRDIDRYSNDNLRAHVDQYAGCIRMETFKNELWQLLEIKN